MDGLVPHAYSGRLIAGGYHKSTGAQMTSPVILRGRQFERQSPNQRPWPASGSHTSKRVSPGSE
jgi:hypothetical protein